MNSSRALFIIASVGLSLELCACRDSSAPDGNQGVPTLVPVSVPPVTVEEVVTLGAKHAQGRLDFRDPVLTYVLVACFDAESRLIPGPGECPGTMLATFAERGHTAGELAFVVLGEKGMSGERTPFGTVISFDPPKCTPAGVLAVARARGIPWTRATTTSVSYAPRPNTTAAWVLKQTKAVLLELTDAECVQASQRAG